MKTSKKSPGDAGAFFWSKLQLGFQRVQPILRLGCNPILGVLQGFKTANVLNPAACPLDENTPAIAGLRRDGFQHRYFTPPPHPMRT
jgi:hypothetical protein